MFQKYLLIGVVILILVVIADSVKSNNRVLNNQPVPMTVDDNSDDKIEKVEPPKIAPKEDEVIYAKTMDEAIKKSKELNKNIFVFFHASWCHNCKYMEDYFGNNTVKKEMSNYIVLLVDTDKDGKLVSKYRVRGIPKYLIINSKEKVLKDGVGAINQEQFIKWLKIEKKTGK